MRESVVCKSDRVLKTDQTDKQRRRLACLQKDVTHLCSLKCLPHVTSFHSFHLRLDTINVKLQDFTTPPLHLPYAVLLERRAGLGVLGCLA
jgi:hypothetical protein